jgi:uncharacterized membrane protein YeaQ/YmgE (transglycosylase-associated protein family)
LNSVVWCLVGAAIGWLAGLMMGGGRGKVVLVENMLVGVFGAFIGGEFVADMLHMGVPGSFSAGALGISVVGAIVLLVLLRLMRGAVGPMQASKSRSKGR